jgi:hypothetical protein
VALKYPNPSAADGDVGDRLPSLEAIPAAVEPKDPVVVVIEEVPLEKVDKNEDNGDMEEEGFQS